MQQIDAVPATVTAEAHDWTETAGDLAHAASQLDGLAFGAARSDAVDAMHTNLAELGSALTDAHTRYAAAAAALTHYAKTLQQVWDDINAAITASDNTDVNGAQSTYNHAHLHEIATNLNPVASDHDKHQAQVDLQHATQHLHEQQHAAQAAQTAYDNAIATLTTAAQQAANEIELGIQMSGLNDSFWDHAQALIDDLHDILKQALAVLDTVLKFLSTALTIVGAVLLVLSLVCPALLTFALGAFELSKLANLADLGVKGLRYLDGDISLGDLVLAGVSALLSYGAGKLIDGAALKTAGKLLIPDLEKQAAKIVFEREGFKFLFGEGEGYLLGDNQADDLVNGILLMPVAARAVAPVVLGPIVGAVKTIGKDVNKVVNAHASEDGEQLAPDLSHVSVAQSPVTYQVAIVGAGAIA